MCINYIHASITILTVLLFCFVVISMFSSSHAFSPATRQPTASPIRRAMSGGLFRTDGGVKGSAGLEVGEAIVDAWRGVREGDAAWLLLETWPQMVGWT